MIVTAGYHRPGRIMMVLLRGQYTGTREFVASRVIQSLLLCHDSTVLPRFKLPAAGLELPRLSRRHRQPEHSLVLSAVLACNVTGKSIT